MMAAAQILGSGPCYPGESEMFAKGTASAIEAMIGESGAEARTGVPLRWISHCRSVKPLSLSSPLSFARGATAGRAGST